MASPSNASNEDRRSARGGSPQPSRSNPSSTHHILNFPFQQGTRFTDLKKLFSDLKAFGRWCEGQGIQNVSTRENLLVAMLPENLVRAIELENREGLDNESWEMIVTRYLKKACSLLGGVELFREFHNLKDSKARPDLYFALLTDYAHLLWPNDEVAIKEKIREQFLKGYSHLPRVMENLEDKLYKQRTICSEELINFTIEKIMKEQRRIKSGKSNTKFPEKASDGPKEKNVQWKRKFTKNVGAMDAEAGEASRKRQADFQTGK